MSKKKVAVLLAALFTSFTFSSPVFAYGAIAVDDEQGETDPGYGFSTGHDTQDEAKRAALKQCRDSGNDHCKVAVWFKSCGAYAASKKYYGYGYGDSKAIATKKALEMCAQKSCQVVVAECE